LAKPFKI